jgi:CDP-paratose 2-epimerase
MKNKIKILITGGFGFVGSGIVSNLLKTNNSRIFIVDNLSRPGSKKNFHLLKNKVVFFKYNIGFDKKKIEDLIKRIKPDHLFHLAGQVAMSNSLLDPYNDFITNSLGTLNILEAIRKYSKKTQLIYASSNKVYGDLKNLKYKKKKFRYEIIKKKDFSEETSLNFSTPYGCSKGSADQYVIDYSKIYNLNFTVFRHSTIYGPKQFFDYNQGWISWFCKQMVIQKKSKLINKFSISGDGKQVRDILHIDDVVQLYLRAIKYKNKLSGEVFNIGGGYPNSISVIELIKYLEKKLKFKSNYHHIKERRSDQKYFVCNIKKIKNAINWTPKISLYKGIDSVLKAC